MNKAQRSVLILAAIAIVAMCYIPPCRDGDYVTLWHMYWFYAEPIAFSTLLAQIAIVCTLATLLTLAFKTPHSR